MTPEPSTRECHVWVLWDDTADRARGKTHALDCHMIDTFHWVKGAYKKVPVSQIPEHVERCGFCGGGRAPAATTPAPVREQPTPSNRDENRPPATGIQVGSTVRVSNLDTDQSSVWTLVDRQRAGRRPGTISAASPIGAALVGRAPGDTFTVNTPGGLRQYVIRGIVD